MLKITREYIMNMIIYCVGVLSAGGQGINASSPPPSSRQHQGLAFIFTMDVEFCCGHPA